MFLNTTKYNFRTTYDHVSFLSSYISNPKYLGCFKYSDLEAKQTASWKHFIGIYKSITIKQKSVISTAILIRASYNYRKIKSTVPTGAFNLGKNKTAMLKMNQTDHQ